MWHLSSGLYFSQAISIEHAIRFKQVIVFSWQDYGIPKAEIFLHIKNRDNYKCHLFSDLNLAADPASTWIYLHIE